MGQAEIQKAAPPSPASNTLDRAHLSPLSGVVCPLADGGAAWLHDGSCMSREAHVQFCERLGVRLPGATHPPVEGSDDNKYCGQNIEIFHGFPLLLQAAEAGQAVSRVWCIEYDAKYFA